MRLRDFLIGGFCLAAGALFATAAAAEKRVALVIGNAAYSNAAPLSNTINDSTAIANLFKSVGFEVVISRNNLGVVEFKRVVREFLITAENADLEYKNSVDKLQEVTEQWVGVHKTACQASTNFLTFYVIL